jgi:hypothetical protein
MYVRGGVVVRYEWGKFSLTIVRKRDELFRLNNSIEGYDHNGKKDNIEQKLTWIKNLEWMRSKPRGY